MKKFFKLSVITSVVGLTMILGLILSKSAYPHLVFRILTPLGLLLVFISVILGFVSWLLYLKDSIKKKEYVWATIVAVLGLLVIIRQLIRLI